MKKIYSRNQNKTFYLVRDEGLSLCLSTKLPTSKEQAKSKRKNRKASTIKSIFNKIKYDLYIS